MTSCFILFILTGCYVSLLYLYKFHYSSCHLLNIYFQAQKCLAVDVFHRYSYIALYSISEVWIVEKKCELLTQNIIKRCMFMVLKKIKITQNILAKAVCMVDICVYFSVTFCSSCLLYVSVHSTHIEDGNDGGVVPTDYGGNVLGLGNLRRDQLNMKQKQQRSGNLLVSM